MDKDKSQKTTSGNGTVEKTTISSVHNKEGHKDNKTKLKN
jgi:hypothetical protein